MHCVVLCLTVPDMTQSQNRDPYSTPYVSDKAFHIHLSDLAAVRTCHDDAISEVVTLVDKRSQLTAWCQ